MKIISATLFLILLLLPVGSMARDAVTCDGPGRYCVGNNVFDCQDGHPAMLERCNGDCRNGSCADIALAPDIKAKVAEPVQAVNGSDAILYITLTLVGLAIIYLLIRTFKDR